MYKGGNGVEIIRRLNKKLLILAAVVCLLCFPATVQAAAKSSNAVTSAKTATGGKWVKTSAGKKYRYKNGKYAKNAWVKIGSSIYRFDEKGICKTGWFTVNSSKYYADKNGKLYVKKWLTTKKAKYYLQASGVCAINKWVNLNKKYYYLLKDGSLATKRMVVTGGKCYYVNASGVRVKSAWVKYGGKKYYFDKNGVRVQSKWVKYKNKYYYLGSDGAMAVNRWIGDYYVGSDGARKKNCTVDGYKLDSSGKRQIKVFKGKYIFVGDSRMVGMQLSKAPSDTMYIAKSGQGYNWLKNTAGPALESQLKLNPDVKVVLALGVNDMGNSEFYIAYYRSLIKRFPKTKFYVLAVNPVDEKKEAANGYHIKNSKITAFNKKMLQAFGEATYIDSNSHMKTVGFETRDGLHYTVEVYRELYDFIVQQIK